MRMNLWGASRNDVLDIKIPSSKREAKALRIFQTSLVNHLSEGFFIISCTMQALPPPMPFIPFHIFLHNSTISYFTLLYCVHKNSDDR